MEWIYIGYVGEGLCNGFEEYISADGKYCKQVWNDGYEEIFERG